MSAERTVPSRVRVSRVATIDSRSPAEIVRRGRKEAAGRPDRSALLPAGALAGLGTVQRAAYDEARIDYHAGLPLVNTPVIRQVISTSRLLIQLNRHQVSARRGAVISGASGTGKTTALSQLGRAHELAARKRHPGDRHRLPVATVLAHLGAR